MKSVEEITERRMYSRPEIICVELDNAIALALESAPPIGPDEVYSKVKHDFYNNPFKANLG
ncbi:MAG: hypothetical protein H6Q20_2353 [Bacteroidetes bacterium]|nr:hypothetical protein [Bacteroidota bacterium]